MKRSSPPTVRLIITRRTEPASRYSPRWTPEECAAHFQVDERTIRRWRVDLGLPAIVIPNSTIVRFNAESVLRWAEQFEQSIDQERGTLPARLRAVSA